MINIPVTIGPADCPISIILERIPIARPRLCAREKSATSAAVEAVTVLIPVPIDNEYDNNQIVR